MDNQPSLKKITNQDLPFTAAKLNVEYKDKKD